MPYFAEDFAQRQAAAQANDSTASNPCVLCLTEEKRLACIPCGHLATCVPCGDSLQACPICRRKIDAFIRVYVWTSSYAD